MLAATSIIPNGIKHDHVWSDPGGPQHDEQTHSFYKFGPRELPKDGVSYLARLCTNPSTAVFDAGEVLLFDKMETYRPTILVAHVDFKQISTALQTRSLRQLLSAWRTISR